MYNFRGLSVTPVAVASSISLLLLYLFVANHRWGYNVELWLKHWASVTCVVAEGTSVWRSCAVVSWGLWTESKWPFWGHKARTLTRVYPSMPANPQMSKPFVSVALKCTSNEDKSSASIDRCKPFSWIPCTAISKWWRMLPWENRIDYLVVW